MRVVGIVGSPRRSMNTETLVRRVLDGCRSAEAEVSLVSLNTLDIRPCQACRVQDGSGCIYRDGMDLLYEAFENADALVLGSPIYYGSVSAQIKLMIDRSYCLARRVESPAGEVRFESTIAKHKKGVVVIVGGGTDPEGVLPLFESWAPEVNLSITGALFATESRLGCEPMESRELLEAAFAKGVELVHAASAG